VPHVVLSVNTSPVRPLEVEGGTTVPSGILKRSVEGTLRVEALGLEGDAQADLAVHGGRSRAVYAYPHEHYPFWETVRAQMGAAAWGEKLPFGALGENLTLSGVVEHQVWIGDLLRFPDCVLAVSAPRFPCHKLGAALGFKHAAKAMVAQRWCGFYLAVRVPGTLAAGQTFEIEPGPREVGIDELFRAKTGR